MPRPERTTAIGLTLLLLACGGPPDATDEEAADAGAARTGQEAGAAVEGVADAGFSTPESVLHDAEADVYLVSNIEGHPQGTDGNGFIARVSPAGEVLELRWIDGRAEGVTLHAPKGMAIVGDLFYVSDIDALRSFDRRTGEPRGETAAPGSFPNDLCAGPDGSVWWTDSGLDLGEEGPTPTGTDAVHRVRDGELETVAAGAALRNPNGCVADGEAVHVVTFGANELLSLQPDGQVATVGQLPAGGLDGIVRAGDALYITSWEGSAVYRFELGTGQVTAVRENLPQPADLGHDATRGRLLVPLFGENRLVFIPL